MKSTLNNACVSALLCGAVVLAVLALPVLTAEPGANGAAKPSAGNAAPGAGADTSAPPAR